MRLAGLAFCRRSRLNSNVRPRRKNIAVNPLASATQQKTEHPSAPQVCRAVLHFGLCGTLHERSFVSRGGQSSRFTPLARRRAGALLGGVLQAPPSRCRRQFRKGRLAARSRRRCLGTVAAGGSGAVSLVRARCRTVGSGCHRPTRPNPSFEPTPNGIALGPRGALVHRAPRGPSTMPPVAAQLQR
jgi:hypothetical protein